MARLFSGCSEPLGSKCPSSGVVANASRRGLGLHQVWGPAKGWLLHQLPFRWGGAAFRAIVCSEVHGVGLGIGDLGGDYCPSGAFEGNDAKRGA